MRSNFEISSSNITRVHLQTVIAVSQLLGDLSSAGLNNSRFQESLSFINSYANSDKVMKNTGMYNIFYYHLYILLYIYIYIIIIYMYTNTK